MNCNNLANIKYSSLMIMKISNIFDLKLTEKIITIIYYYSTKIRFIAELSAAAVIV